MEKHRLWVHFTNYQIHNLHIRYPVLKNIVCTSIHDRALGNQLAAKRNDTDENGHASSHNEEVKCIIYLPAIIR